MNPLLARAGRLAVAVVAAATGAAAVGVGPAHAATGPVAVSLTFDDGLNSQYDLTQTVLARHGVKATFYLNSGAIDKRGTTQQADPMTWARAKEIMSLGHEIGGHTLDHQVISGDTLTAAQKTQQVCDDRDRLVAQGFAPSSFAYPEGSYDDAAIQIVQGCGYASARLAGGLQAGAAAFAEAVPPGLSPYKVRVLGSTTNGPITFEALRNGTQAAVDNGGGWLPILFHMVCYQGRANYDTCMAGYRPVDAAVLDQYLSWVESQGGISVRTFSQVLQGGIPEPPPPVETSRPTLTQLSRGVLGQGARGVRVVLTGSSFDPTTAVKVSGGGVQVRVISRAAQSITVRLSVGARAGKSARSVTVLNGDGGTATCDACLRIVKGPKLTALMRATVARGRTTWVPVRGSGFTRDTRVLVGGKGVHAKSVRFIGPRRLKVAVSVARHTRRTARSVTVVDRRTLGRDSWPKSLRVV